MSEHKAKKQKHPVTTYDVTYNYPLDQQDPEAIDVYKLWNVLRPKCKAFVFQLERGDATGRVHLQARIRLREKQRLQAAIQLFKGMMLMMTTVCHHRHHTDILPGAHWSPTANVNSKSFEYVMKEDTRVRGPFSDKEGPPLKTDEVKLLERDGLYSWQQVVVEEAKLFASEAGGNNRVINVLVDQKGGIGKGSLTDYLRYNNLGFVVPPLNNYKDVMGVVIDRPASTYIIDVPRAHGGVAAELWSALESIKDGYAFDTRYHFRERRFRRPCIWVFTNTQPDTDMLSHDRWRFFSVNDARQLVTDDGTIVLPTQQPVPLPVDDDVVDLTDMKREDLPMLTSSNPPEWDLALPPSDFGEPFQMADWAEQWARVMLPN